jgi:hypothetical protein
VKRCGHSPIEPAPDFRVVQTKLLENFVPETVVLHMCWQLVKLAEFHQPGSQAERPLLLCFAVRTSKEQAVRKRICTTLRALQLAVCSDLVESMGGGQRDIMTYWTSSCPVIPRKRLMPERACASHYRFRQQLAAIKSVAHRSRCGKVKL